MENNGYSGFRTLDATKEGVLRQYFGYHQFRQPQAEVIDSLLGGKDSLVVMPTGGGKSLCYQVPSVLLPGITVVVSPLIALMQDQVRAMDAVGIPAAFLNSSQDFNQQQVILGKCLRGELRLLYVSPERVFAKGFLEWLETIGVSLFAIDESHCVSTWGHDFRPEYAQLGALRQRFPNVPIAALTATADKVIRNDILRQLGMEGAEVFISSFDRPNLSLKVLQAQNRMKQIRDFLTARPGQCGIIYCLSRKATDSVAESLKNDGFSVAAYHAGMDAAHRRHVQEAFLNGEIAVMVATVAFGMGIDKSNIRWVIHYNLPSTVESFYQEIGRAGRDGLPAETILFFSFGDIITRREMIMGSELDPEWKELQMAKLDRMRQYAEASICRRRVLLSYFNEDQERDCGNCDVCQNPPRRFNATEIVQKALSAIARTEERVAMGMLVDILRGSNNRDVLSKGYHQIKTFGAGKDLRSEAWIDYLLQMLNSGFMDIAYDEGHTFKLNAVSWAILRGQREAFLVKHEVASVEPKSKAKAAPATSDRKLPPAQQQAHDLTQALTDLRKSLAARFETPPQFVFSDLTLTELVKHKPLTFAQLSDITGMGQERMGRIGRAVLDVIRAFYLDLKGKGEIKGTVRNLTHIETLAWFRQGMSIEMIAERRKLTPDTVATHLVRLKHLGEPLSFEHLVDAELRTRILSKAKALRIGPDDSVLPLVDFFQGDVPSWQIRLVVGV